MYTRRDYLGIKTEGALEGGKQILERWLYYVASDTTITNKCTFLDRAWLLELELGN